VNPSSKNIVKQLKAMINRFIGYSLEKLCLFQREIFIAPFLYLDSHSTNSLTHQTLDGTHINTMQNCIHFLCKNNWSVFALVGFVCIVSPTGADKIVSKVFWSTVYGD